jgi:hypothetical protein
MKSHASFILFSVMLAGVSCQFRATLAESATANSCVQVGRIARVQGEVLLKREEWPDFHPATVGTILCLGDQLRPAKGSQVRVQCADANQTLWTVRDGMTSGAANGCPKPAEPRNTPFGSTPPSRGETLASSRIPYIISPRRTLLLTTSPTLRWHGVSGAKSYTVRVRGEGEDYWKTEVSGTEVVYAGNPLKPGVYYSVIVETDNQRDSREEDLEGLGFKLLDEQEQSQLQTARNQLTKQELDEQAFALSLADLYIRYDLKAEAIATLEALVNKGTTTAAVYRTLGELYRRVGLPPLAQSAYLRAIELASTSDIEAQAEANASLGEVYAALGEKNKAIQYINQALIKYESLAASERVRELKNQLTELTNQ